MGHTVNNFCTALVAGEPGHPRASIESAGHRVYLASLTGMGDRAHLRRPDINLETHIRDVVNLIQERDLQDVYLVGHSYGGPGDEWAL